MRIDRYFLLPLLVLLAACRTAPAGSADSMLSRDASLTDLLACNDRAIGGDALRQQQLVEFDLEIVEPSFEVDGFFVAARDSAVSIDIFADGERVFSEGWDGSAGWQLQQGATEPVPTSEAGAAALRHGLEQPGHLWTLQDMVKNGHTVELVTDLGQEDPGTRLVKLTLRDGFESWYRIDYTNCHVVAKRDFRAFHPDVDSEERWIESRFEDFRSQDGVTRAWTTLDVDVVTGETVGRTRLVAVRSVAKR
jgi:hypothetical protein